MIGKLPVVANPEKAYLVYIISEEEATIYPPEMILEARGLVLDYPSNQVIVSQCDLANVEEFAQGLRSQGINIMSYIRR